MAQNKRFYNVTFCLYSAFDLIFRLAPFLGLLTGIPLVGVGALPESISEGLASNYNNSQVAFATLFLLFGLKARTLFLPKNMN